MVFFVSLALAGTQFYDFSDTAIQGELIQPAGEMLFAGPTAVMSEQDARRVVRRGARQPPTTAEGKVLLADALRAQRDHAFRELAALLDSGQPADFSTLHPLEERARALYLDAAPDLADDHAARALVLAAGLSSQLGKSPVPQLETALELDPTGPFSDQIHVQLADLAFGQSRMSRAIEGYAQVADAPGRYRAYASYKLAWCRYNQGEFGRALGVMVPLAHEPGPIASEARKDAVLFAGELERPEALAVVGKLCRDDEACAEASRLRLESLWDQRGR